MSTDDQLESLRSGQTWLPLSGHDHRLGAARGVGTAAFEHLDTSFCFVALKEVVAKYGKPETMNMDNGSQFTGSAWITILTNAYVKISTDGRGRYLDNVFIERLWRTPKQKAVYLHELQDGFQAKRVIKD